MEHHGEQPSPESSGRFSRRTLLGGGLKLGAVAAGVSVTSRIAPSAAALRPGSRSSAASKTLEQFLHTAAGKLGARTINVLEISSAQAQSIQSLTKQFESITGITVNWTFLAETDEATKILVTLSGGSGAFDVLHIESFFVPLYQQRGWITTVNELRGNSDYTYPGLDLSLFAPAATGQLTYHGHLLGMPNFLASQVFYYRTDIFAKHGIKKPPATLSELVAVCDKINKSPVPAIAMRSGIGPTENLFPFTSWLYNQGGSYYKSYNSRTQHYSDPDLTSKDAIAAVDLYAQVLQKYGPPGSLNWQVSNVTQAFISGDVAMMQEGTPFGGTVNDPQSSSVAGKVGVFPVPAGPAGSYYPSASQGWAVNKYSSEQEAAWLFAQWAASPNTLLAATLQYPFSSPPISEIFKNQRFVKRYNYTGFLSSMATSFGAKSSSPIGGPYIPELNNWNAAGQQVSTDLNEVITGQKTAKAAMQAANAVLREYA